MDGQFFHNAVTNQPSLLGCTCLECFCFQRTGTSAISTLDVLRQCAIQIYILVTYFTFTYRSTHILCEWLNVTLRTGCMNAQLTIWLANRGLTLTAQLTRCRVARTAVN